METVIIVKDDLLKSLFGKFFNQVDFDRFCRAAVVARLWEEQYKRELKKKDKKDA